MLLADGHASAAASRPVCHDFWNRCISVVTTAWTDEELSVLRDELRRATATCDVRTDPKHDFDLPDLGDPGDPVHKFFHALYRCLESCLIPAPGGHSTAILSASPDSGTKRMFGAQRRPCWPLHPNDLIPFGARQSAEMHVRWCCLFISPAPFRVLMMLVFACRPIIFPHLLESPTRERLLWCIVHMLHADQGRDVFLWPATVPYSRPDRLPNWVLTSATSANTSIDDAVFLLYTVFAGLDASLGDLAKFVRAYEAALLPAISSALNMQQNGSVFLDPPDCALLCQIAVYLHGRCPGVEMHPMVRAWQEEEASSAGVFTPGRLQARLCGRYRRRLCCGPGCSRGVHDTEDARPLSLCAGCKFTQCCSKGCQRADWKHETWPHKRLCRILCLFVPILETTLSVFEEAFHALDLNVPDGSDSDYQLMLRWLDIKGQ